MANVLSVPLSGNIYFDNGSQDNTVPDLSGSAVALGFDGCAGLTVTSYNTASGDRFTVAGESGSLFSVNDSLTGTVFSVNDASGLPIIEVNSDEVTDTVAIGEFGTNALFVSAGYVGVGTNTPTNTLDVAGDINTTGQLLSGGSDLDTLFVKQTEAGVTAVCGCTGITVTNGTTTACVNLTTAGAGAGTYGSTADGCKIDTITLDAYGRVTAVACGTTGSTSCLGTVTCVTAGNAGIDIGGSATTTPSVCLDLSELTTSTTNGDGDYFVVTDTSNVQRKLTKGNINISGFNNDSGFTTCTGTGDGSVTSVGFTAGCAIDISGTNPITSSGTVTIAVDLSELAASTTNADGDYFVVVDDSNVSRKLDKPNILLGEFCNNCGWTSNNGDITAVTAGTNLTGGGTSGSVTINMATGGIGAGTYGNTGDACKIDTITVDAYGRITAIACGATGSTSCTGTVTSVGTSGGLTGGTITGTGTICIQPTCCTEFKGAYTTAKALSACPGLNCCGDITAVTAGTNLTGGGTTGAVTINMATGGVGAGTYGSTADGTKIDTITVDAYGRVTGVACGSTGSTSCTGTVTSVGTNSGLTGGTITGTGTIGIITACCTEFKGAYTTAKALSSCPGLNCCGDITAVTAGTNLTGGGTTGAVTINMATGGVGSGTYGSTADNCKIDSITVDAYGRVTAVACGPTGSSSTAGTVTCVATGSGLTGGAITSSGTICVDSTVARTNVDETFSCDVTINGDLTVNGDLVCLETIVSTTSALSVTNHGSGPAIVVNQSGSNDIANFTDDGVSVLYIEDGGNVGLTCNNPVQRLDVNGNINTSGDIRVDNNVVVNTGRCFVGVQVRPSTAIADTYIASAATWNAKTTCTGTVTCVNGGNGLTGAVTSSGSLNVGAGTGICVTANAVCIATTCNTTWNSAYTTTKALSGCAGLACVGDITAVTAGTNLTGGGTSGSVTLNMATGGAGAGTYGNTGNGCKIDTITLDAYGRVTAVACGPTGSTSCTGTVTSVATGTGLTGGTITSSGTLSINSTCNTTWNSAYTTTKGLSACAGLACTGTTTASNTQTFTNKSGNISQWTNDSGYTTCNGDITAVTAGTNLTGGGTSGSVTINMATGGIGSGTYGSTADGTKIDTITVDAYGRVTAVACGSTGSTSCTGTVTCVNGGSGLTGAVTSSGSLNVGAGTGITVNANDVAISAVCRNTIASAYTTTAALSTCNGLACVGDITAVTAGTNLTGGGTSGSVTLNMATGGAGAGTYGNTGNGCKIDTITLDAYGRVTAVACGPTGSTSCTGTVTCVNGGNGLTGAVTSSGSLNVGAGTGITVNSNDVAINSTCNTTWNSAYTTTKTLSGCAGLACTGTTTASNTQTFTNKSGNISQWTNDSGYTTCTGTTTPSNTQTFTNKSGNISQWTNDSGYTTCTGTITNLAGLGITATAAELNKMDGVTATTAELNYTDGVTSNIQTQLNTKTTCTGTVTSVATGTGLTGGTITSSGTLSIDSTCNTCWNDTADCVACCSSSWNSAASCVFSCAYSWETTKNIVTACCSTWTITDSYYNTKINYGAGGSLTTGTCNVAIAPSALACITTASGNIGIGGGAGRLTTGGYNAYIGHQAGCGSTSGIQNVAIGACASRNAVNTGTGSYNTAIGTCALACRSSGAGNIGVGYFSGLSVSSGGYNALLGHCAGQYITTGNYNFAAGIRALRGTSTTNSGAMTGNVAIGFDTASDMRGNYNVAFGYCTLHCNTTGSSNMAIGSAALRCNLTGSANVAIGCGALRVPSAPSNNIGIGADALCYTGGNQNIGIGVDAGSHYSTGTGQNTGGNHSIWIGRRARAKTTSDSNAITIGCEALSCGSNTIVMGNTSHTAAYVAGGTWSSLSDCRYKTCVNDITKGLEFIGDLKPKEFRYTKEINSTVPYGPKRYGFLAQDVLEIEGEDNVIIDKTGDKLNYTSDYVIPVLVKAVQEQQGIIDDLKARIEALEK